ncbi:MAG: hypothetical protein JWP29_343 [Rhodoferax sp.]|nr:hypothetical protein [Rhodoferax sp.]
MTNRRSLILSSLAMLGAPLAACAQAAAPAWPSRPVRLLVGFPGGSTPDMAARALAEALSHALGQPVIVDNKPGASGNIVADQVAKAGDDHTLGVLINGNLTSAKTLYAKLPYDPQRDFSYLSLLTTAPLLLLAPAGLPHGAGFFAEAKRQGDAWNYGSVGNGSVAHLGMELLKAKTPGLKAVHVPFQGNPQVVTAMLGGQIQMALVPPGVALPHVKSGKLQAIGITSAHSALAPEVAPLADAGVADFSLEVWTALVGPAGLSRAAQARLLALVPGLMQEPATRQRLLVQGWDTVGSTPEMLQQRVKLETAEMTRIIKATGTRLD